MTIFRWFRELVEAIGELSTQLSALTSWQRELVKIQQEMGPAVDRLEALELSRHQFQAEIEGMLLRAEGKLKAANNAEARERQLKKSYEKYLLDPLDSDSREETTHGTLVLSDDAAPSEAQRLPAVHMDLAPNDKANAVRAKWGR